MCLGEDLIMDTKKDMCFLRDWTTCSKDAGDSRFNSQHDELMNKRGV